MIIGFDCFQNDEYSTTFNTTIRYDSVNSIDFHKGLIDDIYMDEDISFEHSPSKPNVFEISTLFNVKFNNSLEGGNIQLDAQPIDYIGVQKRKIGDLNWINVITIPFGSNTDSYSTIDKYISLDVEYEYSIFPLSENTQGLRIISEPIIARFDNVFLSDKENNYKFFINVQYGDINPTQYSKVSEGLNAKYPIVTYGSLDYTSFNLSAWYLNESALDGEIKISEEKKRQEQLLKWLKNKKPKVYRDTKGDLKMVSIVDSPTISPVEHLDGVYSINIKLVEIGDVEDNLTLVEYDLINYVK